MDRTRMADLVERSERPMLLLALVAVALYLADLGGAFASPEVWSAYFAVALTIDAIFVIDLAVKLAVLRRAYVRSPWFFVDLVCALPILSTLAFAPGALQGLRFVRSFRMLRALRMLRVVRSLRILKVVSTRIEDTPEAHAYRRALTVAVLGYAVLFVGLVAVARGGLPNGQVISVEGLAADQRVEVIIRHDDGTLETAHMLPAQFLANGDLPELYLVLGSLLGMMLILLVTSYQIPALWSRQMRALLNVALPQQVADHFLDHPESYDRSVRSPATVVFCDIKGFTSTVEHLPLDELKRHLERALEAVVAAHERHGLIIDKFIGDAVMSFRGGNIAGGPPEDIAGRVVRAALDGERALRELGDPWFREIKMGGASGSDVLIGAFGTARRLSYTVLGDRVNLAARLEASCNAVGVGNLFCDETQRLTATRPDVVWRRVGLLRVQGKQETTMAWQAFDAADDVAWIPRFHEALEAYEQQRFAEAAAAFAAVEAVRPGDGPSALYRGLALRYAERGVEADWQAVLETRK